MSRPDPVSVSSSTLSADETFDKLGHDMSTESPTNSDVSVGTEWDNAQLVGKRQLFPSPNLRSKLYKDEFDRPALRVKYRIPKEFKLIRPKRDQKIYDWIQHEDHFGTGISTASLACGLRFPLHPFIDKLLVHWRIGLGQLMPNSYLQINAFIARCRLLKIPRNVNVFLSIYQLVTNIKYKGFYSIGRRIGMPQWSSIPNSIPPSHKGSHEEWFFIVGPGIVKYTRWHLFKKLKNPLPEVSDLEDERYSLLVEQGDKYADQVNPKKLFDEDWLVEHHISCRGMDKDAVHEAFVAKKKKEKLALEVAKKGKKQKNVPIAEFESNMMTAQKQKGQTLNAASTQKAIDILKAYPDLVHAFQAASASNPSSANKTLNAAMIGEVFPRGRGVDERAARAAADARKKAAAKGLPIRPHGISVPVQALSQVPEIYNITNPGTAPNVPKPEEADKTKKVNGQPSRASGTVQDGEVKLVKGDEMLAGLSGSSLPALGAEKKKSKAKVGA